jgi:UDPglucose 6-dehydrogenase
MKERIVIVGFGWVGQANALALSLMGYPVSYFDPATPSLHHTRYQSEYGKLTRLKSPREHETPDTCFIVCVGDRVSEDGIQDISLIESALTSLKGTAGTVILRSTILPQKLSALPFDFYLPEFLHEKKAVEESLDPYFFVVGENTGKKEPSFFPEWRTRSFKIFNGTPEEASYIKYLSNLWNSVRIAFVNEFGNAIAVPENKEKLNRVERVINFMFDHRPYMRYGRSFGGHCLPKDTRAFMRFYKDAGRDMSLFHGTYASNTAQKKLEEKFPAVPEWFSEWPDRHVSVHTALQALFHAVLKRLGIAKK